MVKKLYRHEFAALFRIALPIAALCIVLSGLLSGAIAIQRNLPDDASIVSGIMTGLFSFAYVISIFAMTVASYFIVIVRFYKHLLSNEGYLTFSFPINPTTHLVCKLICGCVITLFSALVALVSFNIVFIGAGGSYAEIFEVFADININDIPKEFIPRIIGVFVLAVVGSVVYLFMGILLPYASMCIGQLSKKNKLAMSFLWYFVISNVASIISNIVGTVMVNVIMTRGGDYYYAAETPVESLAMMLDSFQISMLQVVLMGTVFSIVYFLIARYILNNKLNLE